MSGWLRQLLLLTVLSASASRLAGQTSLPLAPGNRVRIRTLVKMGFLGPRIDGTVERIAGDTLVVTPRDGGDPQALLLDRETELFVATGRRSSLLRGALIGALAGGVAAGVRAAFDRDCTGETPEVCRENHQQVLRRGALLLALGSAGGAIIGGVTRHPIWTRLSVVSSATPGLVLSLRFSSSP